MRVNRQLTFLFVSFALLCAFLYAISDILLPFVLGVLVAYMMDPLVDYLEKKRIPRGVASGFILIIFFSVIIAICVFTIPLFIEQMQEFAAKLPVYLHTLNSEIVPQIKRKLASISPVLANQFATSAKEIPTTISTAMGASVIGLFHSGLWLINLLSLILITPIVSFYLLRDWDLSLAKIYSLLPQNYAPVIKRQAKKVDDTISAFLRGELTVCIGLGFVYALALSLAGLNFGFLLGMIAGILTFVPYIGPIIAMLAGMMVAYLQFGEDWSQLLLIFGIYFTGHVIESNFITPKVIGDKIGVHPAWLIFGMLAGASLLGTLGVIIAVPVTAVIAVLIRFAIEQYESSTYYLRHRNTTPLDEPLNYRGEPGSLLRVDNPNTLPRKRRARKPRTKK